VTTTVKTPKKILLDAADLLEAEDAWTQGEWHEPCSTAPSGFSYCAEGALEVAAGIVHLALDDAGNLIRRYPDSPERQLAFRQAVAVAVDYAKELTAGRWGIIGYNDAEERKQEEVVAALRGAAHTLP
jgi:hypothetical protein